MSVTAAVDGWSRSLNTTRHKGALTIFLVIVLAHWAEHIVQAFQIWVLGWPNADARGVLGVWFPWLVESEALHYGYALVMLTGFWALRPGFAGADRTWWSVAFGIQVWHHFEHLILLGQAVFGVNLAGRSVPTSVVQLVIPRVELHLLYNGLVFVPMVVAMYLHRWHPHPPASGPTCTCAAKAPALAPA